MPRLQLWFFLCPARERAPATEATASPTASPTWNASSLLIESSLGKKPIYHEPSLPEHRELTGDREEVTRGTPHAAAANLCDQRCGNDHGGRSGYGTGQNEGYDRAAEA